MTKHARLVEFFVNEFYQYKLTDLSHLVATNFTFVVNSKPMVSYEVFKMQAATFFSNTSVRHGSFTSPDDARFYSSIEVTTYDHDLLRGEIMYVIENNLVQKIVLNYELTGADFDKFHSSIVDETNENSQFSR